MLEFPTGYQCDCPRQNSIFLRENSLRKCFFVVIVADGDYRLQNDRSTINAAVDEVNRGAGYFHAVIERLALRMQPGKRRQQRRMDVEYPPFVSLEQWAAKDTHESREENELNAGGVADVEDPLFRTLLKTATALTRIDHVALNAERLGNAHGSGSRIVCNETDNLRGIVFVSTTLCYGFEIRAAARGQDRNSATF